MIIINCDGSVDVAGGQNKSGVEAAYGFIIRKDDEVIASDHGRVPTQWGTTVNAGEYYAILAALWKLNEMSLLVGQNILIRSDSQLIVYQLTGKYHTVQPHLKKLRDMVKAEAKHACVSYVWIPREQNKEADALAGQAWKESP